jgi:hypothetical protein
VLGIADGVDAFVCAFAVLVETECAGGDVERGGELSEETVAEKGFARAADANEEDNQLVVGVREDRRDGFRVGRELAIRDLGVL